jgi:hypothetical protein
MIQISRSLLKRVGLVLLVPPCDREKPLCGQCIFENKPEFRRSWMASKTVVVGEAGEEFHIRDLRMQSGPVVVMAKQALHILLDADGDLCEWRWFLAREPVLDLLVESVIARRHLRVVRQTAARGTSCVVDDGRC